MISRRNFVLFLLPVAAIACIKRGSSSNVASNASSNSSGGGYCVAGRDAGSSVPDNANLTGNWTGSCNNNDNGHPINSLLTIVQASCSSIEIGGRPYTAPSTYTVPAFATGAGTRTETHTLQWSDDGKTLIDKQTFTLEFTDGAGSMQGTIETRTGRDGSGLYQDQTMTAQQSDWQGNLSPVQSTTNCRYAKSN